MFTLLVLFVIYKSVSAEIERHKAEDAMDAEIAKLTKITQCVHVGSIRPFGGHKGVEGAKACDKAYKSKKFLRGDHVRVKTGEYVGCTGLNTDWMFDTDAMESGYILTKVKCGTQAIDSITELEYNLERTYGRTNSS